MNNGLEKILQKIEQDCNTECDEIIRRAIDEAKEINRETVEAASKRKEEILKRTGSELANKIKLAEKANQMEKRNSILRAKNEYIDLVIETALERVRSYDDNAYFSLIGNLILKYSEEGTGVIRFSPKDTQRIPADFFDKVNKELAPFNKSVQPGEPADITDGFILEYRDIDVNCTFESLLGIKADDIREAIYTELFGG